METLADLSLFNSLCQEHKVRGIWNEIVIAKNTIIPTNPKSRVLTTPSFSGSFKKNYPPQIPGSRINTQLEKIIQFVLQREYGFTDEEAAQGITFLKDPQQSAPNDTENFRDIVAAIKSFINESKSKKVGDLSTNKEGPAREKSETTSETATRDFTEGTTDGSDTAQPLSVDSLIQALKATQDDLMIWGAHVVKMYGEGIPTRQWGKFQNNTFYAVAPALIEYIDQFIEYYPRFAENIAKTMYRFYINEKKELKQSFIKQISKIAQKVKSEIQR